MTDRIVIGQHAHPALEERAREFRKNPTPAEAVLWKELKANRTGFHFRRQQVVTPFIVDFYCHEASLVVEVDGDVHDLRPDADRERTEYLTGLGLFVIRFRDEEIMNQTSSVVARISDTCSQRIARSIPQRASGARRSPFPPREGG